MQNNILKEIYKIAKKEFLLFFGLVFFGVLVIWLGGIVAVIGSRDIVKPIQISVQDTSGHELPSVRVFAKLARAGNAVQTLHDKEHPTNWSVEKVFIEKIMIGATNEELARITRLHITIGKKEFTFSYNDLTSWNTFEKKTVKPYIQDGDYDTYTLLEAPKIVRLETSKIPVRESFFSSLINWGGDAEVFIKPITSSFGILMIYIVFLLLLRIIFFVHNNRESRHINNKEQHDESNHKNEFSVYFATIVSTIIVLTCINYLIHILYKPDLSLILKNTSILYLKYQLPAFLPEPVEMMQFILSSVLSPFILGGLYYIFRRKISSLQVTTTNFLYSTLSILAICCLLSASYIALAMSDFLYIKMTYYFDSWGRFIFTLCIFPIIVYLFISKNSLFENYKKYAELILQTIVVLIFVLVFSMNVLNITNLKDYLFAFHFNPVFYPMSQVMAGKMLLVNVTSLYGLFPVFILPLFKLIGLSVFTFSLVMGSLLCVSYLCMYMFMNKVVSNKILLYCGFLALIFYSFLGSSPTFPNIYYQYWPIRILFPAIFLLLTAVYLKKETRISYYIFTALCSLGVLWNFDSGIIVFIAWIVLLSYNELSKNNQILTKFIKILTHIFVSALFLITAVLCFSLITQLVSGSWPDLSLFLQYQKMFLSGYFMIEMLPPPHSWNLVILTYLVGLLISIAALIRNKVEYRTKLIFALTILGIGIFTYFEGRSHDATLSPPSYIVFILVAIFADMLYQRIKHSQKLMNGETYIFIFLLYILVSVPFSIIHNSKLFSGYILDGSKSLHRGKNNLFTENINFIKQNTTSGDSILILAPHKEGTYYAETKTRSVIDIPSSTDLFFNKEVELIIDFLKNNTDTLVFAEQPLEQFDLYDPRIKKIIEDTYTTTLKSDNGLLLFIKKH